MTHDLIHLGLPWWDKAIRTLAVYLGLLVLLRLAGKRQLAQLNTLDLVVLLLLSNVVQNAIIGNETSLPGGLLGAAILIAGNYLLLRLAYRRRWLAWLVKGTGTVLYEDGQVNERNLEHELMTRPELVSGLRREGMELDDVERVDLEPEGAFNAQPKPKPDIEDVMAALQRIEQRLG
ncbi:MAG: YetF domain-containing protein [Gaiellaceae bacterium]